MGKVEMLWDHVLHSPSGKVQHTPMSQPSTAPSTPNFSFSAEGDGVQHGIFFRCISGTSTIDPVQEDEHEHDDDGWEHWDQIALPPLPDMQYDPEEALEDRLLEVKELFKLTFGKDVDDESDGAEYEYDADGTPWVKQVGTGPLTVTVLEDKLAEVKDLYKAKYGHDLDADSEEEYEYDEDGTAWIRTEGTGHLSVEVLEGNIAEVKELFKARYGQDVDDESDSDIEYDADGTPWTRAVGTGPLTLDVLEERLAEVKQLYKEKFGKDVDDSDDGVEHVYDKDGTLWIKTTGMGPLTVEVLEDRLAEVKDLYQDVFGRDADAESDEDSELEYDADGTPWKKTVGKGPLTVSVLEDKLDEVKALYRERFGKDVDEESEQETFEYDEDGTLWKKTTGKGPLTAEVLEDKLAELKDLYRDVFGRDTDAESDEDSELEYDAEGTPWVKTVGQGPLTVSGLEDKLAEVKALCRERFGEDADEEWDQETFEYDEDGTLWSKTVGKGPLTVEVLEDKIDEVKELYERRFGRFVEEESENEEPDLQYDEDGTLWFKWEGMGAGEYAA